MRPADDPRLKAVDVAFVRVDLGTHFSGDARHRVGEFTLRLAPLAGANPAKDTVGNVGNPRRLLNGAAYLSVNRCSVNHRSVNHRSVNHRSVNHRSVNHWPTP
jgi:hypothetical protein